MIKIPAKIEHIINVLTENGYKAYIVGGCVRDALMGITPNDYDVTTNATPEIVETLFERTIPTGIKHGTVTVLVDGTPVEVTTFRTENGYSDSRHPNEVEFVTEIKDDLSRRDFTVNAMAYNYTDGLIDCFGGSQDIKNKILKAVGNPENRFLEDALRILRLFRFAAVLDFEIEKETLNAAIKTSKNLENISRERIFTELYKTAASGNLKALTPLLKCGALNFLKIQDAAFKDFTKLQNDFLSFYIFLHYFSENKEFTLNELKCSNQLKNYCLLFDRLTPLTNPTKIQIKEMLTLSPIALLYDYFEYLKLCENIDVAPHKALLSEILNNNEPYLINHLEIGGKDLENLGITGKKIGEILTILQAKVIENPTLNNKEKLITEVRKFIS